MLFSKLWNQQQRRLSRASLDVPADNGLTLLECLVAIVVISFSVAIITPAVVLAVATRLQSQRAEQAFQVAQSEVDRIKLVVQESNNYTLNIAQADASVLSTPDFGSVPAPEDIAVGYSTTVTDSKGIDIDNDGTDDFAVQIFRTQSNDTGTSPRAFDLGVRVYRADVVRDKASTALATDPASLNFTSGEGQSSTRPLAVIYTSIIKSDTETSLCNYYGFIDSVNGTTTSTPTGC